MTRKRKIFLSLIAFRGGRVAFENNKNGDNVGIGMIDKSHFHEIENV